MTDVALLGAFLKAGASSGSVKKLADAMWWRYRLTTIDYWEGTCCLIADRPADPADVAYLSESCPWCAMRKGSEDLSRYNWGPRT